MSEKRRVSGKVSVKDLQLGKRLKQLMMERRLNSKDLAELSGISRMTIENITRDNQDPSSGVIASICQTLRISAQWLISGDGPRDVSELRPLKELRGWDEAETAAIERYSLPEPALANVRERPAWIVPRIVTPEFVREAVSLWMAGTTERERARYTREYYVAARDAERERQAAEEERESQRRRDASGPIPTTQRAESPSQKDLEEKRGR